MSLYLLQDERLQAGAATKAGDKALFVGRVCA